MQATLVTPRGVTATLGPTFLADDEALFELWLEALEEREVADEDLDEKLALRCASL